ncbi:predicted protein [Lichtheimia corymbifera JMRC:FSU:9682]|uniref:Globin-sensor domain-containing protein n=1 Tax=Lichtheimia corymbifera JMRC:FSU:9682 TaxID=1263082 RepID=A0A068SD29_9FUNG|nr:predicted protein [Lichtheimia corymbifera JMRC:FSU:9682]
MQTTATTTTTTNADAIELDQMDALAARLNFTSQDVKVLQNAATKLAPQIDTMIDAVRSQLSSHFSIDEDMKLGNESLRRYLGRIMTGPYDNRFFNYLKWVASSDKNTTTTKTTSRHDHAYITAVLGTLETVLIRHIVSLKLITETETLQAFSKLLWMQGYHFVQDASNSKTTTRMPTLAEFLWGVPVFLRDCPAFPVVVGALTGGLTMYFCFKKRVLVA